MNQSTGTFNVTTIPQRADNKEAELAGVGRMSIDKQFHGDIEASSTGEMLYIGTQVDGSRAYVALERVTGELQGKRGSFVLYHVGTMRRGEGSAAITILDDSGTDELTGISGTMSIRVENGQHLYDLHYSLPDTDQA